MDLIGYAVSPLAGHAYGSSAKGEHISTELFLVLSFMLCLSTIHECDNIDAHRMVWLREASVDNRPFP